LVLFGQSSGPVEPIDPQVLNQHGSLFLTRPSLAHYTLDRAELSSRAGELFEWLRTGRVRLRIDRTLPLAQAAEAHRLLEGRATAGWLRLISWGGEAHAALVAAAAGGTGGGDRPLPAVQGQGRGAVGLF